MALKQVFVALCALLFAFGVTTGRNSDREDEFSRISKYDSITFSVDYDEINGITFLNFTAFDEIYYLELKLNDKLIGNKIQHTNGISKESSQLISGKKESCHYGIVSNKLNIYEEIFGGISLLCKANTLSARIALPNKDDILYIKPIDYYFGNGHSSDGNKDGEKEHIGYFASDYDNTGFPYPSMRSHTSSARVHSHAKNTMKNNANIGKNGKNGLKSSQDGNVVISNDEAVQMGRNLLNSNDFYNSAGGGENIVELYILVDPVLYRYYKFDLGYGSANWYDELLLYTMNLVNDIHNVYFSTNWDEDVNNDYNNYGRIGTIEVTLVEIEVFTQYTGNYAILAPVVDTDGGSDPNCDVFDTDNCEIDIYEYLDDFTSYIDNYKDTSTFDNAQLWTHINFGSFSGLAWIGTVCRGSISSSVNTLRFGYDNAVGTCSHEMGHNFNARHDFDLSCGNDAGLMGYNDLLYFSDCSIDYVQDYFYQRNGLSCLWDSANALISNGETVDTDDSQYPTPQPTTPAPIEAGSCPYAGSPYDCIVVSNADAQYDWNGQWDNHPTDCINDRQYWTRYDNTFGITWLFYWNSAFNTYWINWEFAETSAFALCNPFQNEIEGCTGNFQWSNSGWISDSDVIVEAYASCDGGVYSKTNMPTSSPSDNAQIPAPSNFPTIQPTPVTMQPTQPTPQPTEPSQQPTGIPTKKPSNIPTADPTNRPTDRPTDRPTTLPSKEPSNTPTIEPTARPTARPSNNPTVQPSGKPSEMPTNMPTEKPTDRPTFEPTNQPTEMPTSDPSSDPTSRPTSQPSGKPSAMPSVMPSAVPIHQPTIMPSNSPTNQPTKKPTHAPNFDPTGDPSMRPSMVPSVAPSNQPSSVPTAKPSAVPTDGPSNQPSQKPTSLPTSKPSNEPSNEPTNEPTGKPTAQPTTQPSNGPLNAPTNDPTTRELSNKPTNEPSNLPSNLPSNGDTNKPTIEPTNMPTGDPITLPSQEPSVIPSNDPTLRPSDLPTSDPSNVPTVKPTQMPSDMPTEDPFEVCTDGSNYNCVEISGLEVVFDSNGNEYDLNGIWIPNDGCFSNVKYFDKVVGGDNFESVWSLYFSDESNSWHINSELSDSEAWAFCVFDDITVCSDNFFIYTIDTSNNAAGWSKDDVMQVSVTSCANSVSDISLDTSGSGSGPSGQSGVFTDECTNNYGQSLCFDDGGLLWNSNEDANFTFDACINDVPFFSFEYNNIVYYLHYDDNSIPSQWLISENIIDTSIGISFCYNSNLNDCLSGEWYILEDFGDSIGFVVAPEITIDCDATDAPSNVPTSIPSIEPSMRPSLLPSGTPTTHPTFPTFNPTIDPTSKPTSLPSGIPSNMPTIEPTDPTAMPTFMPSVKPSGVPSALPTNAPTDNPTEPTIMPTSVPTMEIHPTKFPTELPSNLPSDTPTEPSFMPSEVPSSQPTPLPTMKPSARPTTMPSMDPTSVPTTKPTDRPTVMPSSEPTNNPSQAIGGTPVMPTSMPTSLPTSDISNESTATTGWITPCDNDPCDCGANGQDTTEDFLCKVCHSNGCSECEDVGTNFKLDWNYPCTNCQEVFGTECLFCQDFNGCAQCSEGYRRTYDEQNDLYYCEMETPTPKPTNNPTGPTNAPVEDSSSSCPATVTSCDSYRCSSGEDDNCANQQSWGCRSCDEGYFLKDRNNRCVNCSEIPNCDSCSNWQGCTNCASGYDPTWNQDCGFVTCVKNGIL